MAKELNKERALTLESIRVLDAIDRRGSFAAAADELGKVPSALSYTVQKLEDELDAMLFDRSGHRTKFTPAGRMLLERGRVLLEAAEHLVGETRALARGWEISKQLILLIYVIILSGHLRCGRNNHGGNMFRLQIFVNIFFLIVLVTRPWLAGGNLFIRNIISCSILYVLQEYLIKKIRLSRPVVYLIQFVREERYSLLPFLPTFLMWGRKLSSRKPVVVVNSRILLFMFVVR